jgi:predicted RNA methylase
VVTKPASKPSKAAKAVKVRAGNTRVTGKEQYYTPTALAERLVGEVATLVGDFGTRTVIEPAGGTGSFVEAAERAGAARVLSVDIEPKHARVNLGDFLEVELPAHNAITISNPPFGRNNSLSIPFFNRAAEVSEYIAFIVPRSWRKWSVINRLDHRFHLVSDHDLTLDYLDDAGVSLSSRKLLATCFQVWQRRDELRARVVVTDNGFVAKCSPAEADVALTVFGFGCGTVRTEFDRQPNSTRMFLKLGHPRALEALQAVDFSRFFKNTAYTEALAFGEINYLINEYLTGDPGLQS